MSRLSIGYSLCDVSTPITQLPRQVALHGWHCDVDGQSVCHAAEASPEDVLALWDAVDHVLVVEGDVVIHYVDVHCPGLTHSDSHLGKAGDPFPRANQNLDLVVKGNTGREG